MSYYFIKLFLCIGAVCISANSFVLAYIRVFFIIDRWLITENLKNTCDDFDLPLTNDKQIEHVKDNGEVTKTGAFIYIKFTISSENK